MTEAVKLRPEEKRLLALLRRADALNTACVIVELEEWGYPEAKAEMLETLEEMRVEAPWSYPKLRASDSLLIFLLGGARSYWLIVLEPPRRFRSSRRCPGYRRRPCRWYQCRSRRSPRIRPRHLSCH
jgi:hypothetical protein